jgi:CoA:oxalate CoA-transferase
VTTDEVSLAQTPLDGVVVAEIASNVAGPYTGLLLRDLGARVIKIENPRTGDDVRGWPPYCQGMSAPFAAFNRGKESVGLDFTTPAGLEVMHRVCAGADVLVESVRPGRLDVHGLGADKVLELNPKLVYCSISGFGRRGPLGGEPGFDAIVQAYSGLMNLTGHAGSPPARVGTGVIDIGTGLWAALGIVAALTRRAITGRGGRVESTLLGTASGLMMHHLASVTMADHVPTRAGTAQHNTAPYEAIHAQDGPVMIGVTNQSLWERVCDALECSHLLADPRFRTNSDRVDHRDDLVHLLSATVSDRLADDVAEMVRAAGVPASKIRSVADLPTDPQIVAMDLIQETAAGARLPVSPILFEGRPADITGAVVPELGSATDTVLKELGYDHGERAKLRETGVTL